MRRRFFQIVWTVIGTGLSIALFYGHARSADASRTRFEVEGASVILRLNEASAQRRAIDDGMRQAVSEAVRQTLGVAAMLRNQRQIEIAILNTSPQFVQRYRVLKRSVDPSAKVLKVRLEVLVDLPAVEESIRSLKLGRTGKNEARLLFLVEEHILRTGGGKSPVPRGQNRLGVAERRFLYDFARAGYTPVVPRGQRDPARPGQIRAAIGGDQDSARALGNLYGCPFVVTVRAVVERERGGDIVSLASARVIRVEDGAVIAIRSKQVRTRRPRGSRAMQTALSTSSGRLAISLLPEIRRLYPPPSAPPRKADAPGRRTKSGRR